MSVLVTGIIVGAVGLAFGAAVAAIAYKVGRDHGRHDNEYIQGLIKQICNLKVELTNVTHERDQLAQGKPTATPRPWTSTHGEA